MGKDGGWPNIYDSNCEFLLFPDNCCQNRPIVGIVFLNSVGKDDLNQKDYDASSWSPP